MKLKYLFDYAQAHLAICCVLKALQSAYGGPHEPYDQTHGDYAEAHASQLSVSIYKHLNRKYLSGFTGVPKSSYMEWFMVWLTLNKSQRSPAHGSNLWLVWCVLANKSTDRTWVSA